MQPFSPSAILLAAILLFAIFPTARADEFFVIEHQRPTVYRSPQKPGFTSWVGAWTMPDASLMVSFTQATGPIEGRPQDSHGSRAMEGPGVEMSRVVTRDYSLQSRSTS